MIVSFPEIQKKLDWRWRHDKFMFSYDINNPLRELNNSQDIRAGFYAEGNPVNLVIFKELKPLKVTRQDH
jgi:hypothetical protein